MVLGICLGFSSEWWCIEFLGFYTCHMLQALKIFVCNSPLYVLLAFKESESIQITRLTYTCFKMLDELDRKNMSF